MGLLETLLIKLGMTAGDMLIERENKKRRQTAARPQTVPYPEPVKKEKREEKPAEIADGQYKDRNDLEEFVVPEGITRIGRRAFKDCKCLTKITLPSSLKEIDMDAFRGCASLREVIVPEGVTKMGDGVFYDCSALEKAVLPKSMNGSQIGCGLFADCTALEDVTLPDRLTGEFFNVFKKCELLTSMEIPEGVTKIGSFAFEGCTALRSVKIPETVKMIEHRAFPNCTSLKEIYIPDSVRIIDAFDTFRKCIALEKIRLPIGVSFRKKFDEGEGPGSCFWDCDSLRTVVFGDRSFSLKGTLDYDTLNVMYAALGAERNEKAVEYVKENLRDVLGSLVMKEDADTARALLDSMSQPDVPEEDIIEAVDSAGMMGVTGVFYVLCAYAARRGIHIDLGEDLN